MPGANTQRVQTLTIKSGGTTSETLTLGCDPLLSLQVPTLDSGTLTVNGAASGGLTLSAIQDETGTQILKFVTTTGAFVLGAKALADLTGLAQMQLVSTATQSADRVFTLRQKLED